MEETDGHENAVSMEHRDSASEVEELEQSKSESSNSSAPLSGTEHGLQDESNEVKEEDVNNKVDGSSSNTKKDESDEVKVEDVGNKLVGSSSNTKIDNETRFQVTTDILTEDMEPGPQGNESSLEGSVGDKERTIKTPESISVSVDLSVNNLAPSQSLSRMSNKSEFVYNEHDFPTPDYDIYGPTPTPMASDRRQFSPSKREGHTVSRGEGAKSVTFADEISKGSEADPDNKDSSHLSDKEDQDQDSEVADQEPQEKQEEEAEQNMEQEV